VKQGYTLLILSKTKFEQFSFSGLITIIKNYKCNQFIHFPNINETRI